MSGAISGHTILDRLVARTRLLGADETLVVHGGGNTSSKAWDVDHLGRRRRVLIVKGSGSDMRTASAGDFSALYLDELTPLRERDAMSDEEMVAYLARCLVDPAARRPSIETLLHAFLPADHIDHVHADAICALTNTAKACEHVAAALGRDVAMVEYVRPGFSLSKRVAALADAKAVVLAHHGLVTWGDTPETSYGLTLELVEKATRYVRGRIRANAVPRPDLDPVGLEELLPAIRGRVSQRTRKVLYVDRSQRRFADREDVHRVVAAGPATADHVLRIGTGALVVERPPDAIPAIEGYEERYRAYFDRNSSRVSEGRRMHEPLPRALLIPGLGCVAAGADAARARMTADVAARSHHVAAMVIDAFGEAEALSERDLFGIDYWELELYKLSLAPPPPELAGRIAIVTGASSGIGRAVARDLAARGAHVVAADIDHDGLRTLEDELPSHAVTSVAGDLCDDRVVDGCVRAAVEAYGGIDIVVSNAGIGAPGTIRDADPDSWTRSWAVNASAHVLLTRRAWPVFERQGLGGSIVYVSSKNAFAPGAGFGPYSVAKAAQLQLARVAAIEGGPIGVRANVVNPDAVFDGSKLWSDELRAARAAAHGVAPTELEDFYARRTLLGVNVHTRDVAEAVAFLASDRSRATTGCVLTVDGGIPAAFPR